VLFARFGWPRVLVASASVYWLDGRRGMIYAGIDQLLFDRLRGWLLLVIVLIFLVVDCHFPSFVKHRSAHSSPTSEIG
jgi:hypothetical protein